MFYSLDRIRHRELPGGKWRNTSQSGEEVRRFSEDGWIGEISYE